ncbi:MAG: hypothetical protein ACPGUF_04825 [Litorivicinus sp.]
MTILGLLLSVAAAHASDWWRGPLMELDTALVSRVDCSLTGWGEVVEAWGRASVFTLGPLEARGGQLPYMLWPDPKGFTPRVIKRVAAQVGPLESLAGQSVAARNLTALEHWIEVGDCPRQRQVVAALRQQIAAHLGADLSLSEEARTRARLRAVSAALEVARVQARVQPRSPFEHSAPGRFNHGVLAGIERLLARVEVEYPAPGVASARAHIQRARQSADAFGVEAGVATAHDQWHDLALAHYGLFLGFSANDGD